jgi:hypothetical protein
MIRLRRMKWEKRNGSRTLAGKPEGKKPLGRPRSKSGDGPHRYDVAEARDQRRALVSTAMNFKGSDP